MTDPIESALRSEDAEVRRRALADVVQQGPSHGRFVIEALGDVDWRVRKEAARIAAELSDAWGLLPGLVDALCQGENVGLRNAALEVLERLGPRAASALLVALPRVPDTARKFVVAALGFAGPAGVEKLAELTNDPDPNTVQAALEALARVGGPRAEEALRKRLRSGDPVQRLAALEGLERLEASVALAELEPLLADRLVRRLAVRMLGFADDAAIVDPLFEALRDPASAIAAEAVVGLGRLLERGGPAAREVSRRARLMPEELRHALRGVIERSTEQARRAATWLLLLARDRNVLPAAAELAADDRLPPVALEALRTWGSDAIEPLIAVREVSARARASALEMASDLALCSALPPTHRIVAVLRDALRQGLAGDEAAIAAACTRSIGPWAEAVDATALVRTAQRFPDVAARAAGQALKRLARTEPDVVDRALAAIDLDGPIGAAILPAIAAIGGNAASDRLQASLSADDPRARRAAVMALPQLGGERAVELAGFALADEDVDVQVAAVTVLAALLDAEGRPIGAEHLRLALRAGFEPVVAAAARAVGAIGDRASIPALRDLVSEGRAGVAVAAMESLRALADPALDDLLVEALGQSDEELVKEALRAIAQADNPRRAARVALALEHSAWDVRQLAARLLGRVGGEGAITALRKRYERESDPGVRAAIEGALHELEGGA